MDDVVSSVVLARYWTITHLDTFGCTSLDHLGVVVYCTYVYTLWFILIKPWIRGTSSRVVCSVNVNSEARRHDS